MEELVRVNWHRLINNYLANYFLNEEEHVSIYVNTIYRA